MDPAAVALQVNARGGAAQWTGVQYPTSFVLALVPLLDSARIDEHGGLVMFFAMHRGDLAVLSALLARRAALPPYLDGMSSATLGACVEADGDGYFARHLLKVLDWSSRYEIYRKTITKAGTPADLRDAVDVLGRMLIECAPDFVVADFAPRVLNHPGRHPRLRGRDDDIRCNVRYDAFLPTALCSDRRRETLVSMGFKAETTAMRLRAGVRRDASELALSLASPYDGCHPDAALRRLTGPRGGDGDGALRREIRDALVEERLPYVLDYWQRAYGHARAYHDFVLPAWHLTDPDSYHRSPHGPYRTRPWNEVEARLDALERRPEPQI